MIQKTTFSITSTNKVMISTSKICYYSIIIIINIIIIIKWALQNELKFYTVLNWAAAAAL